MPTGRLLRLLLVLLLPVLLGRAGGVEQRIQHDPALDRPSISPPTQSLPAPVHDEATCAFCQTATFPPCTPAAAPVPEAGLGMVREDLVSPDARIPHTYARRLADSRAPPTLRIA
jgi:hypothetical protein